MASANPAGSGAGQHPGPAQRAGRCSTGSTSTQGSPASAASCNTSAWVSVRDGNAKTSAAPYAAAATSGGCWPARIDPGRHPGPGRAQQPGEPARLVDRPDQHQRGVGVGGQHPLECRDQQVDPLLPVDPADEQDHPVGGPQTVRGPQGRHLDGGRRPRRDSGGHEEDPLIRHGQRDALQHRRASAPPPRRRRRAAAGCTRPWRPGACPTGPTAHRPGVAGGRSQLGPRECPSRRAYRRTPSRIARTGKRYASA